MSTYIDNRMEQIGKFLYDVGSLKVPLFQRYFAWTDEEIKQLWLDITEAMDSGQQEYFLGPMVLKKDNESYEIIDGQQRIATIYIILSIIRRIFREHGDDDRANWFRIHYFGDTDVVSLTMKPKFNMNEINDICFQDYIVADSSEARIDEVIRKLQKKDSNRLLLQAIKLIWECIRDRLQEIAKTDFNQDILLEIEKYLRNNLYVLLLIVKDEGEASLIFETLNDRGVGLSIMDLLKNHIFGKSDYNLDLVRTIWHDVRDDLSEIDPRERFLFHHWSSMHGRTSKSQLFRIMRSNITDPASALSFAKELRESSRIYSALSLPGHPFWNNYDERTRKNIQVLSLLEAQQALPILLAAAKKFNEIEFGKLTEIMVVMAIRYNLIGELRTGVLANHYAEIPPKIYKNEIVKSSKVFRQLKAIYPSDNDFKSAFAKKLLRDSKKIRYILAEIEQYKQGGTTEIATDTKKVNLEHILPIHPSSDWKDTIRSITNAGEDVADYVYRLGNMALATAPIQKGLGAKSFNKKKELLFSKEQNIYFTKMINEYSTWLGKDIEDRQQKLAGIAVKVWRIAAETFGD